jgi:glycosyltransferase involved in cell wall biosynthesis
MRSAEGGQAKGMAGLRIAHLLGRGNLAGTEVCATLLAEAQQAAGGQPVMIVLGPGGAIEERWRRSRLAWIRIEARHGADPRAAFRLARSLRSVHPSVVHAHDVYCWSSLITALCHRGPRVLTFHNHIPAEGWTRRLRRAHGLARRCHTYFVGVSQCTLTAIDRVVGLPADRCAVIPNGIATTAFQFSERERQVLRRRYGCREGDLVIGTVARQTPLKGMDDFLRTAAAIRQQAPEVRFWVVGTGEQLSDNVRLAESLGLGDRVTFWGPREDLPQLYGAMDLYLFTSHWESFGLAVLEAMAAAVPVVGFVPREGGLSELVQSGRTGLLIPTRDPERLAAEALGLLHDPRRREEMTRAARRDVATRFSLDRMMEAYAVLYRTLLGPGFGAGAGGRGARAAWGADRASERRSDG